MKGDETILFFIYINMHLTYIFLFLKIESVLSYREMHYKERK